MRGERNILLHVYLSNIFFFFSKRFKTVSHSNSLSLRAEGLSSALPLRDEKFSPLARSAARRRYRVRISAVANRAYREK